MVRQKAIPRRKRPATPAKAAGPRRVTFTTLPTAAPKPQQRRVAFTTLSTDAPKQQRRVSIKPVSEKAYTYEPPKKKYSTLNSESTWMNMMSSIRKKYGIPRKVKKRRKTKVKKKKPAKKPKRKKPTKTQKKAYQSALRSMIAPTARVQKAQKKAQKRVTSVGISLQDVVKAFPAANKILNVYPRRASLCSLVCKMKEAKKKLSTFL